MTTTPTRVTAGLEAHGLDPVGTIVWSPTTAQLYTAALKSGDGALAHGGPLVVDTGTFTGRSPKDKFVVEEPGSQDRIWWGEINHPLPEDRFHGLRAKVVEHLDGRDPLYIVDAFAGADPSHRIGVRVVTGSPYHALFAKTMFIMPAASELRSFVPDVLVLHAPGVEADPEADGTRTGTFVALHPTQGEVLIGGTFYAGEIKKAIFTVMNDRLPLEGVLPMHCSANVGEDGKVAVFFGLSGTGKTTLSADPARSLIGDDEHGWGASGVFNIEGGCYAKVIRLSAEAEPEIFQTTRTYGTVLENVAVDERGMVDLDDDSKTENTRAAYKLERISNAVRTKLGGSSDRGRDAHRRRVRDPAADRPAEPRPGAVLLPLRLHRQARGHRDRRPGAPADVLDVLRCAVPAAAARRLRPVARREARSARRHRLARQHRLDGRPVRRGPPDADPGDPAAAYMPRSRASSTRWTTASTRSSASRCPCASPASSLRFSIRGRPGATPTSTMCAHASLRACSARTSRDSLRKRGRRSPPQARGLDRVADQERSRRAHDTQGSRFGIAAGHRCRRSRGHRPLLGRR